MLHPLDVIVVKLALIVCGWIIVIVIEISPRGAHVAFWPADSHIAFKDICLEPRRARCPMTADEIVAKPKFGELIARHRNRPGPHRTRAQMQPARWLISQAPCDRFVDV